MQQQMQGVPFSKEARTDMLNKIYQGIQSAAIASGRSLDDVQKYAANIEMTALKQSNGNLVRRAAAAAAVAVVMPSV
jgi:hypothetical protein